MARHHPVITLMVAFGMAFLFAITFVVVLFWSLRHAGGTNRQIPLADPTIMAVMSMIASMSALITWPVVHFMLRDRQFPRPLVIAAAMTLTEIIAVTPFSPGTAFWMSFPSYLIALTYARHFSQPLVLPGQCPQCRYDLRGSAASARCPECGRPISPDDRPATA